MAHLRKLATRFLGRTRRRPKKSLRERIAKIARRATPGGALRLGRIGRKLAEKAQRTRRRPLRRRGRKPIKRPTR